jgi:UDP-N-acetylglucosamine--N-acetylmuramyl-(pentapeptide) pyrophosphoryl-undecaprenol N-acetylglucosamine transferase
MYIFAAGGTGGHIFPAISVFKELNQPSLFITDQRGERYFDKGHTIKTLFIRRNKFYLFDMLKAVAQCIRIFKETKPVFVMGFGGYPSVPTCLAAFLMRIPFGIHEQNAHMGKANDMLSFLTSVIFTGFKMEKGHHVGNPVRKEILELWNRPYSNPSNDIHCLVLGGSQGSKELSTWIPRYIPSFVHVHHQAREEDIEHVVKIYKERSINAVVKPFFHDMQAEYNLAHFVICRSGASTLSELMIAKRPAILIPYPGGGQIENAKALSKLFKVCLREEDLEKAIQETIASLNEKSTLIEKHAKPFATKEIAQALRAYL